MTDFWALSMYLKLSVSYCHRSLTVDWKEASKSQKEKMCLAYVDEILFPGRVVKKMSSNLTLQFVSPSCKANKKCFKCVFWITYTDIFYGFGITTGYQLRYLLMNQALEKRYLLFEA